jgi:hypothetical protein
MARLQLPDDVTRRAKGGRSSLPSRRGHQAHHHDDVTALDARRGPPERGKRPAQQGTDPPSGAGHAPRGVTSLCGGGGWERTSGRTDSEPDGGDATRRGASGSDLLSPSQLAQYPHPPHAVNYCSQVRSAGVARGWQYMEARTLQSNVSGCEQIITSHL